jgi:nicotinamide-nucleotide amidase
VQRPDPADAAEELGQLLTDRGWTAAVAESLTCGGLSAELGRVPGAGAWFLGGVVAYASTVKFDILGVPPGPVVSPGAACAMADSVADTFGADVTVAATGVGGPGPQSGTPAGTVWLAVHHPAGTDASQRHLRGTPEEVLEQTVAEAVALLLSTVRSSGPDPAGVLATASADDGRPRGMVVASPPVPSDLGVSPTWAPR